MPEIEYAFLADAAQIQPGQKFHVLGGGISRLTGPSIPFLHPHLALVVGLRISSDERKREHDMSFVLVDPAGSEVATATGRVVAHGPSDAGDVVLNLSVDMWNLNFRSTGEHTIRISVDGSELKRLPLVVAHAREVVPEQRYLA